MTYDSKVYRAVARGRRWVRSARGRLGSLATRVRSRLRAVAGRSRRRGATAGDVPPPATPHRETPAQRSERQLDETVDASFPASDPPSWTATGTTKR